MCFLYMNMNIEQSNSNNVMKIEFIDRYISLYKHFKENFSSIRQHKW